jgi:hypothetical protein
MCECVFVCACGQTDSLQQQQEMRRGGGKHLPKKKTQLPKTHFLISSLLIFQTLQEENKNRLSNWVATEIWFVDDPGEKKGGTEDDEREREREKENKNINNNNNNHIIIIIIIIIENNIINTNKGEKKG